MLQAYRPRYLDLTLHLICVQEQKSQEDWRRLATKFQRHIVPGTHDSYIREYAPATAAVIGDILQAQNQPTVERASDRIVSN